MTTKLYLVYFVGMQSQPQMQEGQVGVVTDFLARQMDSYIMPACDTSTNSDDHFRVGADIVCRCLLYAAATWLFLTLFPQFGLNWLNVHMTELSHWCSWRSMVRSIWWWRLYNLVFLAFRGAEYMMVTTIQLGVPGIPRCGVYDGDDYTTWCFWRSVVWVI